MAMPFAGTGPATTRKQNATTPGVGIGLAVRESLTVLGLQDTSLIMFAVREKEAAFHTFRKTLTVPIRPGRCLIIKRIFAAKRDNMAFGQ